MKNYYLKRINEFTNIGSDVRPRAVSDLVRGVGGTLSYLKSKSQALKPIAQDIRDRAERVDRFRTAQGKRQDPERLARLKKAQEERKKRKEIEQERADRERDSQMAQAALRHRAARLRSSGNAPDSNPHIAGPRGTLPGLNTSTTYIQIGYILAESMGLIDEGKLKDALSYAGYLAKEMVKDFAAIPGEMAGMAREDLAKIKAKLKKKKK